MSDDEGPKWVHKQWLVRWLQLELDIWLGRKMLVPEPPKEADESWTLRPSRDEKGKRVVRWVASKGDAS